MGLGKTIQVLALLLQMKQKIATADRKPSLLVLPASLLANWKSEIARFTPSLVTTFTLIVGGTQPWKIKPQPNHQRKRPPRRTRLRKRLPQNQPRRMKTKRQRISQLRKRPHGLALPRSTRFLELGAGQAGSVHNSIIMVHPRTYQRWQPLRDPLRPHSSTNRP